MNLSEIVAEHYLPAKRARLRASTLEGYASSLDLYVLPRWGACEIAQIAPADVPADRVQTVFVGISACSSSGVGVFANWNTWGGKNNVDIYTPIAQDVYVNIAVIWSQG